MFDLTNAEVDLIAFDNAIKSQTLPELTTASNLYTGPLLEDCTEEWVIQDRSAREHDCLEALQTLAEAARTAGDAGQAAILYQRALTLDPWCEKAVRGLMIALTESRDRNAALQVYRKFVELLGSDSSAVPNEATSALYSRLRAESRYATNLPKSKDGALPHSILRKTGFLPVSLTQFVGKDDERRDVISRLQKSRLVTLTGPGGIGKTTLALEVAREVAGDYADGVWFVGFESLYNPNLIAQEIGAVLSLMENSGRDHTKTLASHLKGKKLLLILDNCEHLLDSVTILTEILLKECPGLRILATSREALGISGESAWSVLSLPVPDTVHLPTDVPTMVNVVAAYPGAQLFVSRAKAVAYTFTLNRGNAFAVAQVCARLQGIPLAIELAAARVRAMTVQQIAARLDDSLGLLYAPSRSNSSRQETLRGTLTWSYDLLSSDERKLLARLSVFADGWNLDAAQVICTRDLTSTQELKDLVISLADKSLVIVDDRNGLSSERYRLLEIVRQFASEHLRANNEWDLLRRAHAEYFFNLAKEAEPHLNGQEQSLWFGRLEEEHDNLRSALKWYEEIGTDAESHLCFVNALQRFWVIRSYCSEANIYMSKALDRTNAEEKVRAQAMRGAAYVVYFQGDLVRSRALYEEALQIFRGLNDKHGIAETLVSLSVVVGAQCQGELTTDLRKEALELYRGLGDKRGTADVLAKLGSSDLYGGNPAAGLLLHEESLQIYRGLGDIASAARSTADIGMSFLFLGNLEKARTMLNESMTLFQQIGGEAGRPFVLYALGIIECRMENYAAARALSEESRAIYHDLGNRGGEAWAIGNLAEIAMNQGEYAEARSLLEGSLNIFHEIGDGFGRASVLNIAADVLRRQGELILALKALEESLRLHAESKVVLGTATNLFSLASIVNTLGAPEDAAVLLGSAQSIRENFTSLQPRLEKENAAELSELLESRLGGEKMSYCLTVGRELVWEQAIDFGLSKCRSFSA
jgi:predicted ATPase